MDLKGITWVGHVYQKFEAMCLEVEDVMYQDTVKYVEDQVQTVGASVKKFYSDVMQDLLPPSSMDPVKVAVSDFPIEVYADVGGHQKPELGMKKKALKVDSEQLTENSKAITDLNRDAGHPRPTHEHSDEKTFPQASPLNSDKQSCSCMYSKQYNQEKIYCVSDFGVREISEEGNSPKIEMCKAISHLEEDISRASSSCEYSNKDHERLCDSTTIALSPASVGVTADPDSLETMGSDVGYVSGRIPNDSSNYQISLESIESKNREIETRISTYGALSLESTDSAVADMCGDKAVVFPAGSSMNQDVQFVDKAVFASDPGRSEDWSANTVNTSSVEFGMGTTQECDEVNGTCAVSGNELHFVPQNEGKCRPYKTKIRNAIASRLRASRRQEYEQLALWYAGDIQSNQVCSGRKEDLKRSPMHDNCDSDWELL